MGFGPCPGFHFDSELRREFDRVPGRQTGEYRGLGRYQRLVQECALEPGREPAQELAAVAARGPVRVFVREPAPRAAPEAAQGLALVFEREPDWGSP